MFNSDQKRFNGIVINTYIQYNFIMPECCCVLSADIINHVQLNVQIILNKRVQRALGRSREEKVKDQGKAIYRGPLMLSTKYW